MAKAPKALIVGRARDCDLALDDETVSGHHAKLSWQGERVMVEDLASANGTWVNDIRVQRALVRPGDAVLIGRVQLPWSDPRMRGFLRAAAKGTVLLKEPPRSPHARPAGAAPARSLAPVLAATFAGAAVIALAAVARRTGALDALVAKVEERRAAATAHSDEEAYVRTTMVPQLRRALDPTEPVVRNTAVQLASRAEGPYNVGQIAAIWSSVRQRWRYVNDPRGREYVALPKESIENQYAGDCDDFAVTLAAMVRAIGGEARVVFMEGPQGGHAYAEACVREEPSAVATKLVRFYGRDWSRYAGARRSVAYRSSAECPVWLNLDWNASVPGGDYEPERWAVAAYADGRTEILAVAPGANPTPRARAASTASAPRRLTPRP